MTATMHASNNAERCRRNGWGVGTRLVGDEGNGPTVIEITAIGETCVLARCISHNGQPRADRETTWTLTARDWQTVDTTPPRRTLRDRLRAGGTSPTWIWSLLRLWECPCGHRSRSRSSHMGHQLACSTARAHDGQG